MNRDYRVVPQPHTAKENLNDYLDTVGDRLIDVKDLWPTPKDYREVSRSWAKDLVAGLTVGIVALPLALGFGVASGAGAAAGLATAVVAGLVAAIFGGSHLQVSGPTGAMTVVLLPVIATYGLGAVPTLALLAGLFVVIMAITGLGKAVDLLPVPVVEGFTMGIGVIIALQQIPLVLGTPKAASESSLVSAWLTVVRTAWGHAWQPILVALFVVAIHLAMQRVAPRVPVALVAVIAATIMVELTGLDVARIGALPSSLPMPSIPPLGIARELVGPALAVAALAALESLLSARVADGMTTIEPTHANRELMGQGLANIAVSLVGGLPATGAIARTAVNVRAGARTRLAAVVHALVLLVIMLFLGPVVALIPMAALGGVLLMVAIKMIRPGLAMRLMKCTSADRNTFVITFAATVVFDLVAAVLAGIAMAAIMSVRHVARYSVVRRQYLPAGTRDGRIIDFPPEHEHMRDRIAIFRADGALFYGDYLRYVETVTKVEDVAVVILRFHRMTILDASGAEGIRRTIKVLHRRGIDVIVEGMTSAQLHTMRTLDCLDDALVVGKLQEAVDLAVAAAEKKTVVAA